MIVYLICQNLLVIIQMGENSVFKIPYSQQRYSTLIISMGFFLLFIAFSPIQAVITKIYLTLGHEHFGPITLAICYATYAFSSNFAKTIIKNYGYKRVFICGALTYTCFQCSGLIIYLYGQNKIVAWVAVSVPAFLCGFSAGIIWVAQSSYIGRLTQIQYRDEMFGLFIGIKSIAILAGYVLNMYLLARFTQDIYFIVLILLGLTSIIFFALLPYTEQIQKNSQQQIEEQHSIIQIISSNMKLLTIKGNRQIYSYTVIEGLIGSYATVILYRISFNVLPDPSSLAVDEYHRMENYYLGIFLFFHGLTQVITGFLMKPLAKIANCYQIAFHGTLLCIIVTIITLITFYLNFFWLDCLIASLWGILFSANRSNLYALVSKHFNNSLQMFGVQQFLGALTFSAVTVILSLCIKISMLGTYCILIILFTYVAKDCFLLMKRVQSEHSQKLMELHQYK